MHVCHCTAWVSSVLPESKFEEEDKQPWIKAPWGFKDGKARKEMLDDPWGEKKFGPHVMYASSGKHMDSVEEMQKGVYVKFNDFIFPTDKNSLLASTYHEGEAEDNLREFEAAVADVYRETARQFSEKDTDFLKSDAELFSPQLARLLARQADSYRSQGLQPAVDIKSVKTSVM